MICADCGVDNRQGRKFCAHCGRALRLVCSSCGAQNEAGEKFCGECGAGLGTPSSVVPAIPEQSSTPRTIPIDGVPADGSETARLTDGERRHLTVLFCDLVGSTEIAARLDPEEWRETVAGYHRAAAEAITRFGGHVAKYLGDGVMALFGYPEAHDNDAERAARAGLAILDAIAKLNEQPGHAKLSARVGIDSGLVVVGKGAGNEIDVFGDAPNIAARVEAAAEPGTVVITDATHRLVPGLFIVEDRGAQTLKGIERPLQLYRVIRPSGVRGRFDAATAAGGLTPFVGREDELRSLMNRWERALDGEGQVVLDHRRGGDRQVAAGAALPGTDSRHTAYLGRSRCRRLFPEHALLSSERDAAANARRGTGARTRLVQLATRLTAAGLKPADALPLIAPLLNLPLPPEYPPSTLAPEQQRRRLLATLVEWVLGSARASRWLSRPRICIGPTPRRWS